MQTYSKISFVTLQVGLNPPAMYVKCLEWALETITQMPTTFESEDETSIANVMSFYEIWTFSRSQSRVNLLLQHMKRFIFVSSQSVWAGSSVLDSCLCFLSNLIDGCSFIHWRIEAKLSVWPNTFRKGNTSRKHCSQRFMVFVRHDFIVDWSS